VLPNIGDSLLKTIIRTIADWKNIYEDYTRWGKTASDFSNFTPDYSISRLDLKVSAYFLKRWVGIVLFFNTTELTQGCD